MFSVGDKVRLKVDKESVGVVVSVSESVDGEVRYSVFHDANWSGEYYEDQLTPYDATEKKHSLASEDFVCRYAATKMGLAESSSMFSLSAGNIKFIPYQFRPLKRIIRAERPRILIADEVGVGKTIEAGIILKEYERRENVQSAAVICPKELCPKWQREMRNRFDETFLIIGSSELDYCLREMELEGTWPVQFAKCIIGLEMIRRTETVERISNLVDPITFDMVILDEAHHVVNNASNSHAAAEYFCDNGDIAVFLSATPIQLRSHDLYVLLNLLLPEDFNDESQFAAMAEPNRFINGAIHCLRDSASAGWQERALANLRAVPETNDWSEMRFKDNRQLWYWMDRLSDAGNPLDDSERVDCLRDLEDLNSFSHVINRTKRRDIGEFTLRDPVTVEIEYGPEELAFYQKARDFEYAMYEAQHGALVAKMIMSTIERLMTSSLPAFVAMLRGIVSRGHLTHSALTDDMDTDDYDVSVNNEIRAMADELLKMADGLPKEDAKAAKLKQIIYETSGEADSGKLLVFSFFKHTLRYLLGEVGDIGSRVALITGDTPDDQRNEIRDHFRLPKDDPRAIDVLLSSEVGCEGLDYEFCSRMVNYDIPWNPMKIEQRIGRIDRFGQKSPKVRIYNFVTAGTVEERIFYRCFERLGIFNSTIGDLEAVLGAVQHDLTETAFDLTLNEKQQQVKAQQYIDNAIRDKEEQEEYESNSRDLFLMDVEKDDETVDRERQFQVRLMEQLVIGYLHRRVSSFQSSEGEPHEYKVRIGKQDRKDIHKDLLVLKKRRAIDANSEQFKNLDLYLTGDALSTTLFFDSGGERKKEGILVTTSSPLVTLALEGTDSLVDAPVFISARDCSLPAGNYEFGCYEWQERGYRNSNSIVSVVLDEVTGEVADISATEFESVLLSSDIGELDVSTFDTSPLDVEIRRRQLSARTRLREVNEDVVARKLTTLDNSYQRKIERAEIAAERVRNEKIKTMRAHQIKNLEASWETNRQELIEKLQADILVRRLAYGMIKVV